MATTVLLNGEFMPASEANVSAFDGGFLHGAGLFETMRAENERVFQLESHIARLQRSASQLLIPIDRHQLPHAEQFSELLAQNGLREGRVRLTVTAGGMKTDDDTPQLTICATASSLSDYPSQLYDQGVTVIVSQYRQSPHDPIAGHKTTSYLPRLLSLREARQARCIEAIWFTTHNHLAEGSISNVFLMRDGKLKTPPVDTPILPGLARELVLKLAGEVEVEFEECVLSVDDLLDADEIFLTNSIMQVMPVVRVEKKDIADGKVGAVTKKLYEAYRETVRKECRLE
jgi:branched-chain amino acid aminotransferase